MQNDNSDTNRTKRQGGRVPVVGAGNGGPTPLRQQSYVGQRPGAYWSAPGIASASAGRDDEEEAGAAVTRNGDTRRQQPRPSRDPEVLLEAEPVLSILVNATPIPVEMPVLAEQPPMRRRPKLRTIVVLLATVAIVGGAVAAGVILGTSSQSSKENSAATSGGDEKLGERPAPSPPPTEIPSRVPASVGGGDEKPPPSYKPATATPSSATDGLKTEGDVMCQALAFSYSSCLSKVSIDNSTFLDCPDCASCSNGTMVCDEACISDSECGGACCPL
jgi:hypothetical protein